MKKKKIGGKQLDLIVHTVDFCSKGMTYVDLVVSSWVLNFI